jgi:hypothetical protein
MTQVPLENLTPRQRQAYILRFRRGWRLRRIAAELGITVSSAGELVKRALVSRRVGEREGGRHSGQATAHAATVTDGLGGTQPALSLNGARWCLSGARLAGDAHTMLRNIFRSSRCAMLRGSEIARPTRRVRGSRVTRRGLFASTPREMGASYIRVSWCNAGRRKGDVLIYCI